jgi:hypothetical protein
MISADTLLSLFSTTQGVRLINLENGDKVCSVAKASES